MKTKRRKLSKVKLVKELSRERIGRVPSLQVLPNKKKNPKQKHKKEDHGLES